MMAVIVTALIASVAAFGILMLAMSGSRTSETQIDRLRAQYAAEAGLVWAKERLWADPTYCGTPPPPALNGMTVSFTFSGTCAAGAPRRIEATVTY